FLDKVAMVTGYFETFEKTLAPCQIVGVVDDDELVAIFWKVLQLDRGDCFRQQIVTVEGADDDSDLRLHWTSSSIHELGAVKARSQQSVVVVLAGRVGPDAMHVEEEDVEI